MQFFLLMKSVSRKRSESPELHISETKAKEIACMICLQNEMYDGVWHVTFNVHECLPCFLLLLCRKHISTSGKMWSLNHISRKIVFKVDISYGLLRWCKNFTSFYVALNKKKINALHRELAFTVKLLYGSKHYTFVKKKVGMELTSTVNCCINFIICCKPTLEWKKIYAYICCNKEFLFIQNRLILA